MILGVIFMVGEDVGKASDIFSSLLAFFYLYFV